MKPLIELHLHLDGSLRRSTMLEIAAKEGVPLPGATDDELYKALDCGTVRESLARYLEAFGVTVSVMQSKEALRRIASELLEDAASDGVRYAEVRFMPSLHTKRGLAGEEVVEAVLEGLRLGGARHGIGWGLIVCSMRHVPPSVTRGNIDLAIRYRGEGVAAVDLAGNDELEALEHVAHYRRAKERGLHVTIHAAEAGPAERAREAVDLFGAERIGHGVRIHEDPSVVEMLKMRGVALEVCPTSNIQTKAAESYALHPAARYFRDGLMVTISTDNRMLADVTLADEFAFARQFWKLTLDEERQLVRNAIDASFADAERKKSLHARFKWECLV